MYDRVGAFEDGRGASHYLAALRDHWLLIATLVAIAVGAAAAYSLTAEKRYRAEADVLVTPIASDDPTFIGLPLLREGDSQTRAVVTAARLVTAPQIVDAVRLKLGAASRDEVLGAVDVTPVGQASVIVITGEASDPNRAAEIANTFASEVIEQRTQKFQSELTATIARLRAQLTPIPAAQRAADPQSIAIQQRLGNLTGLVGTQDPTLQVLADAIAPQVPVWPRPVLSIGVALLASLLLGAGIALALELVSPRVNREEELLLEQRMPILTRVPRIPRRAIRNYLTGRAPLPASVREAYRTLRATLTSSDGRFPQTVLVTSAMPGEGKTMTSVNLAITLALSGQRVILADGDLRRPMVATIFGVATQKGLADLLLGEATPEEALITPPGHGNELRLLLAQPEHAHHIDLLQPDRVERVLSELKLMADVLVIDSPPVTEVADALTLADEADAVLVAVRLGHSRRDRLIELRRRLAQRGIAASGFVVTLSKKQRGSGYYYGSTEPQELPSPRSERPAPAAAAAPVRAEPPRPVPEAPPPAAVGGQAERDDF